MNPQVGLRVRFADGAGRRYSVDIPDEEMRGVILAVEPYYNRQIVKVRWNTRVKYPSDRSDLRAMRHYWDTLVVDDSDPNTFEGRVFAYIAKELNP